MPSKWLVVLKEARIYRLLPRVPGASQEVGYLAVIHRLEGFDGFEGAGRQFPACPCR